MKTIPKIYQINRDRALEIMWYMDAIYNIHGPLKYSQVCEKVNYNEWIFTQMYFQKDYKADKVIKKLENSDTPQMKMD